MCSLGEYLQGFPRKGAPNNSGVLENGDAQSFPSKFTTLKPSPHYYTVIRSPASAFQWSQNAWPWMTSRRVSRCSVLASAPYASASTRQPCLAYINVPLSTYCKIPYVLKFTAASRASPCDSTAILYAVSLGLCVVSVSYAVGLGLWSKLTN